MSSRNHPADGGVSFEALSMTDPKDGEVPDGACVNYERCGNVPPHQSLMCPDCLDAARHGDRDDGV